MKMKNNMKWDIDHLHDNIEKCIHKVQDAGRIPYGLIMHPETLYSIVMSDEYRKQTMISTLYASNELFFYKVVGDKDMHFGEWEVLVRER